MSDVGSPLGIVSSGLGRPVSSISSSIIKKQDMYRRGIVRLGPDNKTLINAMTGEVYNTSLENVISEAASTGLSELNIFTKNRIFPGVDLDGFGPLSDLIYNINDYLALDDPEATAFRSRVPLLKTLEDKNLELVRAVFSDTTDGTYDMMTRLYDPITYPGLDILEVPEMLSAGTIAPPGYLATRDNQSILLRLRYATPATSTTPAGFKYLTGEETSELLNALGAQDFNTDRLTKIINPLNADGTQDLTKNVEGLFAGQLGKSQKRIAQSLVERNMVINQEGVGNIVNLISRKVDRNLYKAPTSFQETFLFFDSALETTLKAFDLEANYSNQLLGSAGGKELAKEVRRTRDATRLVMSGETKQSAQQYFRSALELQGLSGDGEFNEFENVIRSQYAETMKEKLGKKISLQDIISKMQKTSRQAGLDPAVKSKYNNYINALDEMSKIDDGSGFITSAPFKQHAQALKQAIESARTNTGTGSGQADDTIGRLTSQLNKIVTNSEEFLKGAPASIREFEHDTARLFIGKGQGKSVFDMIQGTMADAFEALGFIGGGSEELYKKEISFGRFSAPGSSSLTAGKNAGQQITMNISSGLGRDAVYSEPQAMIFHPGQYGTEFRQQVTDSAQYFKEEIDNIMVKGRISQRLKRSIRNDATLDIEGMDPEVILERFGSREKAIDLRAVARMLQDELATGRKVNEIPDLANKLLEQAQREAFITKGTYNVYAGGKVIPKPLYNFAIPYAQRQAIDTEGAVSRRFKDKVLGISDESTFSRFTTDNGDELSLFKFRHVGHKMLIPDIASTKLGLYEAGGGFDLDDKWITNLQSVKNSQGVRKLVAFAWRQPTGPQEFALMAPHLDESTMMRMFGDETQMGEKFRNVSSAVSEMIDNRKNFITGLTTDLTNQIDARQLEQLTKEEKIYKYLNALAHSNGKMGKQFKQSAGDITQEDLQRAIFNLVDLNGRNGNDVDLFGDGTRVNVNDFAKDYMDSSGKSLEDIQYKYFNIGATDASILRKAASTDVGTMLKMTVDELKSTSGDILTSYRESSLTQLMKTATVPDVDSEFIKSIGKLSGTTIDETNMGYALREAAQLYQSGDEFMRLQVSNAMSGLTQRSNLKSIVQKKGLGKYVNRLGFAASSEGQRFAALDRIIEYADNTNPELAELARAMKASTSFVYNPEQAIDAALAGSLKVNLLATPADMLQAFAVTSPGTTKEAAQKSVATALYSLMANDNLDGSGATILRIAESAGLNADFITKSKNVGKYEDIVTRILAQNNEFSQELMNAINVNADNVGQTLVKNTAKQIGMIRAIQDLYPEIDFDKIGKVGLDQYSANIKLSSIIDYSGTTNTGDVHDVIDSINSGAEEVERLSGRTLPTDSSLVKMRDQRLLPRATKVDGQKPITGEEVRAKLLSILGLEDDNPYKMFDPYEIMKAAEDKNTAAKTRLKTLSFNPYAPNQAAAARFKTPFLANAMKEITANIKESLRLRSWLYV